MNTVQNLLCIMLGALSRISNEKVLATVNITSRISQPWKEMVIMQKNVLRHVGFVGTQRKRSSHQCLANKYVCVLDNAQVYSLPVPLPSFKCECSLTPITN